MRRLLILLVLLIATAGAAGLIWHWGDQAASGPGAVAGTGTPAIGGPFRLTDQYGRTRTEKDFVGHFMLIYFGYTNCPDVCPTTLSVMADAMEKLAGAASQVTPIFITVDPQRDTPQVLRAYMAAFGPNFVGLTGSQAQIAKVCAEYRIVVQRHAPKNGAYAVYHSNTIYLIGPGGHYLANYDETLGPEKLTKAILEQMG